MKLFKIIFSPTKEKNILITNLPDNSLILFAILSADKSVRIHLMQVDEFFAD